MRGAISSQDLSHLTPSRLKALKTPKETVEEIEKLSQEQYQTLLALLRPGGAAKSGFLGEDEDLLALIKRDIESLEDKGITPQEVGLRLQRTLYPHLAQNASYKWPMRERYNVPEWLEVEAHAPFKGFQSCPFRERETGAICGGRDALPEEGSYSSINFKITNTKTGECVRGGGLLTHLATEHSFFEGQDVPYRTDPLSLARVLGL